MSSPHQIRITDAEDAVLEAEQVTFKTPATPGKRKVSASWLLSPPLTDSSPSSGSPSPALSVRYCGGSPVVPGATLITSSRLESPDTLELCGFNTGTAQTIFNSYTARPADSPSNLLDYAKAHVNRLNSSAALGKSDGTLLDWVGLKSSLIEVFLKEEHATVRNTQSLHFWVIDTIEVGYFNVMATHVRLKVAAKDSAARRKDGKQPKLTGTTPAGSFTNKAATASSQPSSAHFPDALVEIKEPPTDLAGHQVLYKGNSHGEMVLNADTSPENAFLRADGSINISAMAFHTKGDFNGFRQAYYLTPDIEVAKRYQEWAADRNKDCESWIVMVQIPNTYINTLNRQDLWYGTDFRRYVWVCRKGQFDLLPERLYKYNDAELIVGHTAKYPDLHNRAAAQVQDDWSDKLVMVGDPQQKAVQWCFDYVCTTGLQNAIRGKVHVDVFPPIALVEPPVGK